MTSALRRAALVVAIVPAIVLGASIARAQSVTPTLAAEGAAQVMLTPAYRDRFDWGGVGFLRAGVELIGPLAIQLGFGTAWFPVNGQDPGNLYALELGARGFFRVDPTLGGPVVDANAGVGITGDLVRFVFDVGVGWDFFPLPWLGVGPVVRYQQIVQPDDQSPGDDAHLLSFGANLIARIDLGGSAPPPEPAAPPADADDDGLSDDADACPAAAEDPDRIEDGDGCPEDDADSDGIADADDRCATTAEVRNGIDDEDGCPDEAPPAAETVTERVTVTEREHGEPLSQQVLFRVGADRVSPRYRGAVEEVCAILAQRPDVRVRVIGHADEQGTRAGNARLGASRAGAVAEQLVICGVDPERIETQSFGDTQPTCEGADGEACHQQNRRVTFELLTARAREE